jgi:hypothetical protein
MVDESAEKKTKMERPKTFGKEATMKSGLFFIGYRRESGGRFVSHVQLQQ